MNFMAFHILGMSSSQLTNSHPIRGVGQPPTRSYLDDFCAEIFDAPGDFPWAQGPWGQGEIPVNCSSFTGRGHRKNMGFHRLHHAETCFSSRKRIRERSISDLSTIPSNNLTYHNIPMENGPLSLMIYLRNIVNFHSYVDNRRVIICLDSYLGEVRTNVHPLMCTTHLEPTELSYVIIPY